MAWKVRTRGWFHQVIPSGAVGQATPERIAHRRQAQPDLRTTPDTIAHRCQAQPDLRTIGGTVPDPVVNSWRRGHADTNAATDKIGFRVRPGLPIK